MNIAELLHESSTQILEVANQAMERSHPRNYELAGKEQTHQRLKGLFVLTTRAVKERNLGPMTAYAESIARERYAAGYDLSELQTAFNVLEEAIWMHILHTLPAAEYGEALGLVSTVLGAGKDTVARTFVTLASKSRTGSLNLQSLFSGAESGS